MLETAGNFEQNQNLYRNIQDALSDSQLTPDERDEILLRYNEECANIQSEASDSCIVLSSEILDAKKDVYQELRSIFNINREDIKKIQILSGVGSDGLIGPKTFAGFLRVFTRFPELRGLGVRDVLNEYDTIYSSIGENFSSKSLEERMRIQQEAGTYADGVFGPNTFRSLMGSWDEVQDYFSTQSESEEAMTQEDISISTGEALGEIGEENGSDENLIIENRETLSYEEKKEKFITQARTIPEPLISLLQMSVGTSVDGVFGPMSADATIQAFPDTEDLHEVFQSLNISLISDIPVSNDGSPEVFRNQYNPFMTELARQFSIPVGLIDSIIGRETDYGANLMHSGGSKGLMQLTNIIFEDMRQDGRRERIFRPLFQRINIQNLVSIELGDSSSAGESIPGPIQDIFATLSNPETSNQVFDQNISILQNYLKGDSRYFNHLTNMIVGSLWLSHNFTESNGDIYRTARNYNGNPVIRDAYGRNIVERYSAYTGGQEYIPEESGDILDPEKLSFAISWIESRVSEINLQRLAIYFELERNDNPNFISELALKVAEHQSENQLTVDGKPGSQTLGSIDFTEINLDLLPQSNREFIENFVPDNWREVAMNFISRLDSNEILSPGDPITIADSSRRQAIYLINGEYRTFPVIFGSGGFADGAITSGDGKTPRGVAHKFTSVRIASSEYGDASNAGSRTVLGASLQNHDLGALGGGKWFHGVADHRIPGGATNGCVGMSVQNARAIARDIQRNGNKGFGFVA